MTGAQKLPDHRAAILVFFLALSARVAAALWGAGHVPPTADGKFYHVVAQRIAEGAGYTWLWPDGAVTYAAHYPVGYPALVGGLYALFGPHPLAAMLMNALLGAIGCVAMMGLCADVVERSAWPSRAQAATTLTGLILAGSPSLIAYTPALMTEGAVATVGALAARLALANSRRPAPWGWLLIGVLVGCGILLRPQMLLLAPLFGAAAARSGFRPRMAGAVLVTALSLATCAPWTARNCLRMERCLLVSANGGWNLLIGTFPEGQGAWVGVDGERVPEECRTVFQEAAKDACFGQAGRRRIKRAPGRWLGLLPAKWRATFDYTGAAANHLKEAGAIGEEGLTALGALEIVAQRLGYLLSLWGLWAATWVQRGRPRGLWLVGVAGLLGFLGLSAWLGWFVVCGLAFALGRRMSAVGSAVALGGVLATLVVHGVFFGAGRYSLPLLLWTAPWLALGLAALPPRRALRSAFDRAAWNK